MKRQDRNLLRTLDAYKRKASRRPIKPGPVPRGVHPVVAMHTHPARIKHER